MKKIYIFILSFYYINFYSQGIEILDKVFPLDPFFSIQWGANNLGVIPFPEDFNLLFSKYDADIDLPEAWAIEQGDSSIVLAVIEYAGIQLDHPEFEGRIWVNDGEIPDNGIDDDKNGYVDDINGYNFKEDNNNLSFNSFFGDLILERHSTMVSSVAIANANNGIGIAGVDWNCKLMPLVISTPNELMEAIRYASDMGADVINISSTIADMKGTPFDKIFRKFLKEIEDKTTIVVAVSNSNTGEEQNPNYLAKLSLEFDNIIAVGGTNPDDSHATQYWFSNSITNNTPVFSDFVSNYQGSFYGEFVTVVAPANLISVMNIGFGVLPLILAGNSFAAPQVSGICTLLLAQDPSRTPAEIKKIIIKTSEDSVGDSLEDTPSFDVYHGYGRVNAYDALMYKFNSVDENIKPIAGKKINLSVYPNPANGFLNIEGQNISTGNSFLVYDESGRVVLEGNLLQKNPKTDDYTISITSLEKGIFWLQITKANGEKTTKKIQVK